MIERLRDHWLTIDPRSVGLFRVALGIVLLLHFSDRWSLSGDFYGPTGVLPARLVSTSNEIPRFPTVLTAIESYPGGMTIFFAVATCAFAALTVGLWTRGAALVSLLAFSSLAHRNPYVLIGGDYVLGSMLLWMQVLPLSDRFSWDALRRNRTGRELPDSRSTSRPRPSIAALGVFLQLGLIYLASAWQKTGSTWWQDGTALAHVLGMQRFLHPGAELVARLPESWLTLLTRAVLVFEYLVLPLILLPMARPWLRRAALLGLATLHLGIASVLDAGVFSITMLACLPLLLSSQDWDWFFRLAGRFEQQSKAACQEAVVTCRRFAPARVAMTEFASLWLLLGMVATGFNINFAVANRDYSLAPLDLPQRFAAAYQRWDMFTPDAPKCDPQLLVRVRLLDGRLLALQSDDEALPVEVDLAPRFRSFAWRIYIGHAILQPDPKRREEAESLRTELCRFITREVAATDRPLHGIYTVELWARSVPTRIPVGRPLSEVEPYWVSSLDLLAERRERLARR
ncbi:MAG: HTTM domain-containing protein [Candidatus Saccharimonas sp.]|nr:HTTM domain-containing protein [Planctomycetaceae bacterium]